MDISTGEQMKWSFDEEKDKQTGNGDGSYRSIQSVIIKKILRMAQGSYRGSLIIRYIKQIAIVG